MIQWATSISFSLGIWLASMHWIPLEWMLIALAFGLFLLAIQFKWKGFPRFTFVWNVVLLGSIWFTFRTQIKEHDSSETSSSWITDISHKASDYASGALRESGMDEENVAVLNAMLLGNRKALTIEQKKRFRSAGVQHLLALSGLHLGIFIGLFSFIYLRRARNSPYRWSILFLTLVVLWGYCFVAGMPQSLLRAMLMTTLYYIGLFRSNESWSDINLSNTLLIMLLLDPSSLFDIGTQLSFVAVGALIWLYPVLSGILPQSSFPKGYLGSALYRLWQLFAVSVSAWMGTLPLILLYFHQFQLWQPIASVILVPMTTLLLYMALVLMILCLVGIWFIAKPLSMLVSAFMGVENKVLEFAGALPWSTMRCVSIHPGHVAILYLVFFMMAVCVRSPRKVQLYGFPALLFSFLILCII